MKKNEKKYIAFILAAILMLTGCSFDEPKNSVLKTMNDQKLTFTDDLGRRVTVENPQRVAALLGSYADMWMLAGGTVQASADDAWEDFLLLRQPDCFQLVF